MKMQKSKRLVKKFVNHLFAEYKVPRIPVHFHWHHPSIVTADGEYCFGVFVYDEPPCIHVACKRIGKTGVLSVVAHEFVHYLQHLHGWEFDDVDASERAAEYYGAALLGKWLINHSGKGEKCNITLAPWQHEPAADSTYQKQWTGRGKEKAQCPH